MQVTQATKRAVKDAFPQLWLRWHFSRRPKSAERELLYLHKIIGANSITVDVGANCGLYTRELAKISNRVHAFEPSHEMASLLRRTSASNTVVHEMACSDRAGHTALFIPDGDHGPVYGLASLERHGNTDTPEASCHSRPVRTARLDSMVEDDVAFVKVDVEGHELRVLYGASGLIDRCQPIFLVEAEDRHRDMATSSVFDFFKERAYHGFYLEDDRIHPVEEFDPTRLQNASALLSDGGRKDGRSYVNNFFFFPSRMNGQAILQNAIR
ncbi:FkbM family methyltransferase [Afipia felis]|uniref:Methyltransferase, FkbM family n=2 Tax=Afipia felis TaxID=1035 RepID=A0A380W7V6_AFIFE|nr:FkbM family methyltransferase [Afipia felis]EKS28274.1 FkbM family methyltransferase [Afipia felis ATCC 53690]SUU76983.1 methyltransferase, FkbM family [Afipia felis]SUU85050.1 methyltransferase, FkbM family [Afipia felis]